jgi:hypothetical protein
MVFYYKELFRPRQLKFNSPLEVDESFYIDIKERLEENNQFKFKSAINFWRSYWFALIEIMICFISGCLIIGGYYTGVISKNSFLFPFLFIVVAFKPSLYFIRQMRNYNRYVKEERQFHSAFIKAVQDSADFTDFSQKFYRAL